VKITFIGATRTVTGSRFLLEYQQKKILVDCGLYQGPKELRDLNWLPIKEASEVEAVLLTHAHIDHSGALPLLVKQGFRGPIFCSEATRDLAEVLLMDAAYLQQEDADYANRTLHSKHKPAAPLFTTEDAIRAIRQLRPVPFYLVQSLLPGLGFQFKKAGHILGSSLIEIHFKNEKEQMKTLVFTGDLGNSRSPLICSPDSILEADYLVSESTYGDRCLPKYQPELLAGIVNRILGRGGTLVIPAFALGRSQEVLYRIRELENLKLIPSYPVYLDSPMALDVTVIYLNYQDNLRVRDMDPKELWPRQMEFVKEADESMILAMSNKPKIILSASGMLQGGRVLHHLKTKLPDEKNGVLFVGYQGQGTKGRLLKNGIPSIRLHHQEVEVNAEIFSIESFSSHADSNELMSWYKNFKTPPEQTFLVHGEEESSRALYYRLTNDLKWTVHLPRPQDTFLLD
jgi:metallo-beta-lactamase family protein